MDCCICSPMASVYRPPRNTICSSCYEGARGMLALLNELDEEEDDDDHHRDHVAALTPNSALTHGSKSKDQGMSYALKRMKEMKEKEKEMKEKERFLGGLVAALREGIHTDILVRPGSGPPIPSHRALLATKSEIFRNMLAWDECKAAAEDSISFPELSHEELSCLLDFLYSGSLPSCSNNNNNNNYYYSLLIASDKYDIPFLRKQCERRVLAALRPSNALQVLRVSNQLISTATTTTTASSSSSRSSSSGGNLKEQAMDLILKHVEEVVFSAGYDEFARNNAHLSVEITRALLTKIIKLDKGADHIIVHAS